MSPESRRAADQEADPRLPTGTDEERAAFRDASTRDATGGPEEEEEEEKPEGPGAGTGEDRGTGTAGTGAGTGADAEIPPQLTLRFEEVTETANAQQNVWLFQSCWLEACGCYGDKLPSSQTGLTGKRTRLND